jgi:hypothetical protein
VKSLIYLIIVQSIGKELSRILQKMADWQTDRLTDLQAAQAEWQTGILQTGRLVEWQNGRMAEWQNG